MERGRGREEYLDLESGERGRAHWGSWLSVGDASRHRRLCLISKATYHLRPMCITFISLPIELSKDMFRTRRTQHNRSGSCLRIEYVAGDLAVAEPAGGDVAVGQEYVTGNCSV
jgi:hypothetical protein